MSLLVTASKVPDKGATYSIITHTPFAFCKILLEILNKWFYPVMQNNKCLWEADVKVRDRMEFNQRPQVFDQRLNNFEHLFCITNLTKNLIIFQYYYEITIVKNGNFSIHTLRSKQFMQLFYDNASSSVLLNLYYKAYTGIAPGFQLTRLVRTRRKRLMRVKIELF